MSSALDPVCLLHGKRRSEHVCLYCGLCFTDLTPETCWADEHGQKWDLCRECGEAEGKQTEHLLSEGGKSSTS